MSESAPVLPAAAALQRGESLMALGRYDEAIVLLSQAVAAEPHSLDARCSLAAAYLGADKPAEARREADVAAAVHPTSEWPHRIRAVALSGLGDRTASVAAAREAVRLAPGLSIVHRVLADAEREAGNLDEAETAARQACELGPNEGGNHNSLGLVELDRKRWAAAEKCFREALRHDPEDATALNNLGVALLRQGLKREAVHYFAAASRNDPRDSTARKNAVAAVSAGGAVVGVALVQAVRPIVNAIAGEQGVNVLAVVLMVAGFGWVAYATWRWFRRRQERRTQGIDDPKASRQLMRELYKESKRERRSTAGPRRRRVAVVLLAIGALLAMLLAGSAFANVLDPVDGDTTPAGTYVAVAIAMLGLAALAVFSLARRLRRRS